VKVAEMFRNKNGVGIPPWWEIIVAKLQAYL